MLEIWYGTCLAKIRVGERVPYDQGIKLDNIHCIEASDAELEQIRSWGLPVANNPTRYFGDHAKFIVSNWLR